MNSLLLINHLATSEVECPPFSTPTLREKERRGEKRERGDPFFFEESNNTTTRKKQPYHSS
jgi:hypothetical protein